MFCLMCRYCAVFLCYNTNPLVVKYFKVICASIPEHYLNETDAGVQMHQIEALGISTQRSTFTTWDR